MKAICICIGIQRHEVRLQMRRDMVALAAIILIVGLSFIVVSVFFNPNFHGTSSEIFPASKYTTYENGLYVTMIPSNLTYSGENDLGFGINSTISSFPGTEQYALVPVSKLTYVNASNYKEFDVAHSVNTTQDVDFNNVPAGSYAYVTPQNNVLSFVVTPVSGLEIAGITGGIGLYTSIIGIILLIIGVVLPGKAG